MSKDGRFRTGFGLIASALLLVLVASGSLGCAAQGDAGEGDLSADPTTQLVSDGAAVSDSGLEQRKAKTLYEVDGYYEAFAGFSEDGKYIVTDYPALIDSATGKVLWEGKSPTDGVKETPDGLEITAGSYGIFPLSKNGAAPVEPSKPEVAPIASAVTKSGLLKAGESLAQGSPLGILTTSIPGSNGKVFVSTENILVEKAGSREGSSTSEILIGLFDDSRDEFDWLRRVPAPQYVSNVIFLHLLSDNRVMFQTLVNVAGKSVQDMHTFVWGKDSSNDWSYPAVIPTPATPRSSQGVKARLEDETIVLITPAGELFAVNPESPYLSEGDVAQNSLRDSGNLLAISPDGSKLIDGEKLDGGEGFTVVGLE